MRLSYITTYDALDVNNWSGLGYYISKALTDQGNTMNYIGNLDRNLAASTLLNAFYYRKLLKKGYPLDRDLAVVKAYANQIREKIGSDTDVLFSPGSIREHFIPIPHLRESWDFIKISPIFPLNPFRMAITWNKKHWTQHLLRFTVLNGPPHRQSKIIMPIPQK